MPAADRRTPSELLAENDELSRLLLLEVSGERAPAMLRGFPTLVEAAAQMWSTLPRSSHPEWPGVDPMYRLAAIAVVSIAPKPRGCGRVTDRPISDC